MPSFGHDRNQSAPARPPARVFIRYGLEGANRGLSAHPCCDWAGVGDGGEYHWTVSRHGPRLPEHGLDAAALSLSRSRYRGL